MHNAEIPFNGLTEYTRTLLLLVQKDGQYLYPSRAQYDRDYKWIRRASLAELYSEWKCVNRSLVAGRPSSQLSLPLDTPSRIKHIRQVLGFVTKLEGVCTNSAIPSWAERVSSTRSLVPQKDKSFCRRLLRSILGPAPLLSTLVPQHGPGAVANGERGFGKSQFSRMYAKLLPYGGVDLLHLNENHWWKQPYCLELLDHPITKVIEVEKDVMKRRVISEEPLELQFLQQGVARYMMRKIERSTALIRFTDQVPNRNLAKCYFSLATLDMSDASDLVSRRMVWNLFPPDWRALLFALRSHFGKTPSGLVPLRCFAPMGSALCFPVESLVFYVLASACLKAAGCKTRERITSLNVYGDDIIVPRDHAKAVMEYFGEIGFKPNKDKCCIDTVFRESCGAEYWAGDDVSVIRPKLLTTDSGLRSLPMVDLANRLYTTGYESAAAYIASNYRNIVAVGTTPPCGNPALPWAKLGRLRWNEKYQRLEQQMIVSVTTRSSRSELTDYAGLFMAFTNRWRSDMVPAPYMTVKRGWVAVRP